MIKPGTLCMVVNCAQCAEQRRFLGRVVTVTGPLRLAQGKMEYPIDGLSPYDGALPWTLMPINDPDSAPADPTYTKRRSGAYSYVDGIRKKIAEEARK